jgi:aspartate/tyrosine/aromatic aminotransferase
MSRAGVYHDAAGQTPVMRAIKAAEGGLFSEQRARPISGRRAIAALPSLLLELAFGTGGITVDVSTFRR